MNLAGGLKSRLLDFGLSPNYFEAEPVAEYSLKDIQALVAAGTFALKATRCRDSIVEHFGCTTKEAREKFQEMSRR